MTRDEGVGHAAQGCERSSSIASRAPSLDTLVVGLGNPLRGDDGIGVRAIKTLVAEALPEGVEVVEGGTQGLGLVSLMEGWPRVILVDAANVGQPPGGFVRFTPQEVHLLGGEQRLSIHNAGLRDALLLAETLDLLPDEIIIYGMQPANMDWDDDLSPHVEAAMPELVRAILDELGASIPTPGD
jgi:hydrogenase maturation protease